jgi:hypothetical protein
LIAGTAAAMLAVVASAWAATVGPSPHDYGSQNVGASSAASQFTLFSSPSLCTSEDPMLHFCLTSITPTTDTTALGGGPGTTTNSGDFTIHNLSCPYPGLSGTPPPSLGPGPPGVCQFEATFTPTTGGARSTTLTFPDDGGPAAVLSLTGTGIAPTPASTTTATKKKCKKKHRTAAAAKKKCKKKRR